MLPGFEEFTVLVNPFVSVTRPFFVAGSLPPTYLVSLLCQFVFTFQLLFVRLRPFLSDQYGQVPLTVL